MQRAEFLSFVFFRAVFFLFLGSVSEFPGEVFSVKLPSLPSGIGLFLEAGLPLADRCLWREETLPQSLFLGNFSQMIIHLNGSIFTPGMRWCLGATRIPDHLTMVKTICTSFLFLLSPLLTHVIHNVDLK